MEKEKKQASKDEQYSYTVQIQAVELQIKTEEYNAETKEQEIDKLEESLQNAEVYSEVEGVVKEVNETPATDANGQPKPFISVLSSGQFRVKGTVSELNIGSLYQGQAVTIHSRVDDTQVWQGVIETIETEPTDDTTNGGVIYYGVDSGQQSSKYNFYVTLSSLDGLILGQHVYIQPDMGLGDLPEGLWLPAFYIAHDDDGSYVWAQNDQGALEKRAVILGEYDSDNDRYQIESGLTEDDYITMPTEGLEEGNPTTSDITQVAPEGPAGDSAVDGGHRRWRRHGRRHGGPRHGRHHGGKRPRGHRRQHGCSGGRRQRQPGGLPHGGPGAMMLELKNIYKNYTQGKMDVPVLKDISLSVDEGEYVAIMGPSGSGKTTLMNIIGCLDSPTSGEYILEGKDISQSSDNKLSDVRLHSIGFVFKASTCSHGKAPWRTWPCPCSTPGCAARSAGDCPQGLGACGPGGPGEF